MPQRREQDPRVLTLPSRALARPASEAGRATALDGGLAFLVLVTRRAALQDDRLDLKVVPQALDAALAADT